MFADVKRSIDYLNEQNDMYMFHKSDKPKMEIE